jgi:hypothetical protein
MKAHIKSVFGTFQGDSTYIILDTIPPLPPTNVATSIIESSKTLFTWEHSLSPDVIGYNVNYTRVSKGSNTGVSSRITTGYNTSALWDRLLVFGGANDSTIATKTLSVQAVDKAGNESDPVSLFLALQQIRRFLYTLIIMAKSLTASISTSIRYKHFVLSRNKLFQRKIRLLCFLNVSRQILLGTHSEVNTDGY